MSDLELVVAMAAITYASRAALLLRPRPVPEGFVGRFLDRFPVALFIALATLGLAAPNGEIEASIALVGAAGALVGSIVTKRSLLGVTGLGYAAWWLARLLT